MAVHALLAAVQLSPVEQDHLLQARQMQAMSFAVHIPLTCFGIAFPSLVVFCEWLHHRTGDPVYRQVARRWSKVMAALFAAGVVTGTILSFEMGLLWPAFMAAYGEVFGLGFALEGFSFFLEAIFIGVYLYGWDRLSPRAHLLSGIPVIVAGMTGSLFVISVNAWMNHPGGFTERHGTVTDVRPVSALFGNAHLWPELLHMYLAAYIVVGFLVAAVYAFARLRGDRGRYNRVALLIPLTVACLAAPVQLVAGDWLARRVARDQPIKLAALEGLGKTERRAPVHIAGWYTDGEVRYGLALPRLLSLLAYHDPDAEVRGLNTVPRADQPPVNVVRISFQAMVGIGTFLALLALLHLSAMARRRGPPAGPWFLRAVIAAGPLSVVALVAGWVVTEVGRQPWVVYGFMRTEDAVTGAGGILVGYGTLAAVYAGLVAAVIWILRRLAATPLDAASPEEGSLVAR
ncbi:MAG: cytochrome bd ubiquinol oxidase subunit [Solirubrobacteraceae bacterium]|jgi:cytochrome d ubiquinol oxidase subunit I|nr:cytochrome bd ubiquinol oxidase subunit [Solirubrobacteraceae bacterium]